MYSQAAAAELVSALVRFYSREDVSKYIKNLMESYQKQVELHGDKLGSLLRTGTQVPVKQQQQEKKDDKVDKQAEAKAKQVSSKGWVKMGSMLFNTSDPRTGSTEVTFQIHEEMKQKLARTAECLKSFEEASASIIPEGAQYLLYVRNGIPERLIVDSQEKRSAAFSFEGKFKIV